MNVYKRVNSISKKKKKQEDQVVIESDKRSKSVKVKKERKTTRQQNEEKKKGKESRVRSFMWRPTRRSLMRQLTIPPSNRQLSEKQPHWVLDGDWQAALLISATPEPANAHLLFACAKLTGQSGSCSVLDSFPNPGAG